MQTRQGDDECMHDFGFSKQKIYISKVFDFSDFSKFWKSCDVTQFDTPNFTQTTVS